MVEHSERAHVTCDILITVMYPSFIARHPAKHDAPS